METIENRPRLDLLYQLLIEMVSGNYNQRIARTDSKDHLEALSALVNMIADQIRESIIRLTCIRPFYAYPAITQFLIILDETYQIKVMGDGAKKLLQYGENDVIPTRFKKLLHSDSKKVWTKAMQKMEQEPAKEKTVELTFRGKSGLWFPAQCQLTYFTDDPCHKGKILVTAIGVAMQKKDLDQSLHKNVYKQLQQKSMESAKLTALPNHLSPADIENLLSARDYINNHLDSPFALKDVAFNINSNEFKLKTQFKEMYGVTVFQFIKEQRLQKAYNLVLYSNKPIRSIAKLVGFKQGNHLSREFKKRFGQSPTQLRLSMARSETKNFNTTVYK